MVVVIIAITTIIKYLSALSVQASAIVSAADARCAGRSGGR
jgi:hypothetical protein